MNGKSWKKIISVTLVIAMCLSMLSCARYTGEDTRTASNSISDVATVASVDEEPAVETDRQVAYEDGAIVVPEKKTEAEDIVDVLIKNKESNKAEESAPKKDYYTDEDNALTVPFDIAHPEVEAAYADNTLLIKMKPGFKGSLTKNLQDAGVGAIEKMFEVESGTWYTAYIYKDSEIEDVLSKVRQIGTVEVAEYNYAYETTEVDVSEYVGTNPKANEQWYLNKYGIKESYKKTADDQMTPGGDSSVVVAVIDTGVDYNHVDLKANIWKNVRENPDNGIDDDGNGYVDDYYGIDMTAGHGNGGDDHGHGTHVAGIIAASNNNEGVVGIAYNAKIMPIKAGDASGYFLQSNVAKAVMYAYENGAEVINMSFGGSASTIAVQDALATAYSRCVLIASAGNDGRPNEDADYYYALPNYPAALSYVVGVMSVGSNGVESAFSNWDCELYNKVEYEVYAPGEQILSTLPGDRYGVLSGTSMAAPVVSAEAAILRSYYRERNTYPTKFIYGQIVGSAGDDAICCNPQKHTVMGMLHNVPKIVDFYNALTEFPVPNVSACDYTLFDTATYEADTQKIAADSEQFNNGDGIIDAGEIIALGFTLRNRWGKSKDTIVSIDTTNELGMSNPYITILNNNLDYGSIGTYSESDSGKIYDESGERWTGWKNPFYIKVSKDCPNNYTATFYIVVTCKNALDETDTKTYTTKAAVVFDIRRGVTLPNKITSDMTLTSDNYYIIPNSTIIMEGATVTVEPGTKIQFWCSDPQDAYADTAITYLKVQGKFICDGTEAKPVELFPSDWMDKYQVELYSAGNGYVELNHTIVTNPKVKITKADSCEFIQNYAENIYYRYLSQGQVYRSWTGPTLNIDTANNCAIYKLCYGETIGNFDGCIFVDSCMNYELNSASFTNCVFYGNNTSWSGDPYYGTSSIKADATNETFKVTGLFCDADSGITYMACEVGDSFLNNMNIKAKESLFRFLGAKVASIDSTEELKFIRASFSPTFTTGAYYSNGKAYNYNGTSIPEGISVETQSNMGSYYSNRDNQYSCFDDMTLKICTNSSGNILTEVPGEIYVRDIKFSEYVINLDKASTYAIGAVLTPTTASTDSLIYESEDESIAKVSEDGIITPVSDGSTRIYVYSSDRAVSNYLTVNVVSAVDITDITIVAETTDIPVGKTLQLRLDYSPLSTTKKSVTFESSDESILTVNKAGTVTGKAVGTASVTVRGANGITDTIELNVVIPATGVRFKQDTYVTTMNKADGQAFYPEISPSDATKKDIVWESANPAVCFVNEAGQLEKKKIGSTTLRATVKGTAYSAELKVIISEEESSTKIVDMFLDDEDDIVFAIDADGALWMWGGGKVYTPKKVINSGVRDVSYGYLGAGSYGHYAFVCNDAGEVLAYKLDKSSMTINSPTKLPLSNIVSLSDGKGYYRYYAVDSDGIVWAWGDNDYCCLGLSSGIESVPMSSPKKSELGDAGKICKVVTLSSYSRTYMLDDSGNVFLLGGESKYSTPHLIDSKATDIYLANNWNLMIEKESGFISVDGTSKTNKENTFDYDGRSYLYTKLYYNYGYAISDGAVFTYGYNQLLLGDGQSSGDYYRAAKMNVISQAEKLYVFGENVYIQEANGAFYALGSGTGFKLGNGNSENASVPARILFATESNTEKLSILSSNLVTENSAKKLKENPLVFTFSDKIRTGGNYSMITLTDSAGKDISLSKKLDFNHLQISARTPLEYGKKYTLKIAEGAIIDSMGGTNETYSVTFTYSVSDNEQDGNEDNKDSQAHDAIVDADKLAERYITVADINALWDEYQAKGINSRFYSNVIINRTCNDDVTSWMRIQAPNSENYTLVNMGMNYWGTTNDFLINKQIIDFDDYQSLADVNEGEILTEIPENVWPVVTSAYLMADGEVVKEVGNQEVTFVVEFNRDMDTSIPLAVGFGSSYPYNDYSVEGAFVTPRHWAGTITLTTLIENGYEYFSVRNGKAADSDLKLYTDWGRFQFKIDTSAAQAMLMQAEATDTGINLTWYQDDFETLAGYNIYRSETEDGLYNRINKTVISADTRTFFDDTVLPGKLYYYNFTVVQSDMSESEPSGKISLMSKDTMAPNIYHSPVYNAFTGNNIVLSATITDNVVVSQATVFYRTKGAEEWKSIVMTGTNDKYTAIIPSTDIDLAGLEYYIEATDGVSITGRGSAENPYEVSVQYGVNENDMGDVDGNGQIELKDALMIVMAINDKLNLTPAEFARADINGDGTLESKEALRILKYVNGTIQSVLY